MDEVATRHCQAKQGVGPAPDLQPVASCVAEAEAMLGRLCEVDRVKANMIIGCGWHILEEEAKSFEPLLHVSQAPAGSIAPQDQLSAILTVMPSLKRRRLWAVIVKTSDKARSLANGVWVHHTLPYMKGIALQNLNRPAQAADLFEESIGMNPGWHHAYMEFDKAVTTLRDFPRCRKMAQRLVDHGGHWVNCWQRPDHFLTDKALISKPWYDAQDFELARLLEENFAVIKAELDALRAANFKWGKVGSSDRGNDNSTHDADLVSSGVWSEIVLLGDTGKCADNCRRCPETVRLLRSRPEAAECAALQLGESLFSQLQPGTHLRPHCGPTNMRLTCHLGLEVPEGCEIICGGETRIWTEGKCIVFDDSYEHEVRHTGTEPRSVLLVNFWHTDLQRERWPELVRQLRGEAPPTRPAAAAPPEAACRGLFEAVRAAGGHVSAKMARGSAPPLNIPGVLAAEPLEAGEELCRIPARLHISPPGLRSVAPALCQAVEAAQDLPAARRPEALQALFLAQLLHGAADRAASGGSSEALSGRPQTVELDDGVWGVWERYADVLRGEDFAFHPYRRAAAEPDAIRTALEPSPEADFFIDMARDVRALHQVATETCSAALGRPPPEELFLRARLCMLSRGFKTCQDSTLVPVVDLFNHAQSPGQGVSWRWDEQAQAMVVTAVRAHKAGEELFFSYGPRSNLLLYRTYGFTHPPEAEPVWSYIVRPGRVASVYDDFLPGKEPRPQLVLDSENLEASLCEALNAVTRAGRSAAEFLRALCSRCKSPYEEDSRLRPALEALQRARAKDPTSRAWWSELREADRPMAAEDGVRVKMCEYLCLVAHLEALGGGPEAPGEGGHLRGTERLRESLGEALEILAAGRDIAVEAVPRAEAS